MCFSYDWPTTRPGSYQVAERCGQLLGHLELPGRGQRALLSPHEHVQRPVLDELLHHDVCHADGSTVLAEASAHAGTAKSIKVKRALTLLVVDTHSVEQHDVFVGHLSHHAGRFKESLELKRDRKTGPQLLTAG